MSTKSYSILIVNPNSTTKMTDALRPAVEPLLPPDTKATYFTAPAEAPPSIDDEETSRLSADVCLPHLLPLLEKHDAFVIACYSSHPLVPLLRKKTQKPIVGIFEASVYHSLALLVPEEKFGIVTTGKQWETLLTNGVERFLGSTERLAGVASTGFNAVELERAPRAEVEKRIREATRKLVEKGVGAVCLGCAGMVGFDKLVGEVVGEKVAVVDGVKGAVGMVRGMLGCGYA